MRFMSGRSNSAPHGTNPFPFTSCAPLTRSYDREREIKDRSIIVLLPSILRLLLDFFFGDLTDYEIALPSHLNFTRLYLAGSGAAWSL